MSRHPYDDRGDDRYSRADDRYAYADRDRDPPRQPPAESGGSSAVPILAIIGGVLAVLLLVCGGLVWYVLYSVNQASKQVTGTFAKVAEKQQEQFGKMAEKQQEQFAKAVEKEQEKARKEEKERKEQQARSEEERREKLAEKRKGLKFANSFISEAKAGRTEEAYAMTTAAYRKRVSEKQLAELTRKYANTLRGMGRFRDLDVLEQNLDPPFNYTDKRPVGGREWVKVEVTVVKEDDDWKIDKFSIESYDPFEK
jgi:hypothetical protein